MTMINQTIITPLHLPWNWSADFQRQTCLTLAKNNEVIVYLYHEGHFFLKKNQSKVIYPKIKNIHFHKPIYFIPFQEIWFIRRINTWIDLTALVLKHYLKSLNRASILLWIFDPYFYFLTYFSPFVTKIYDCVDDTDWHRDQLHNIQNRIKEKILIKKSNFFFVISHSLYYLKSKIKKPATIVPQGFDLNTFKKAKKQLVTSSISVNNKIIIGFVGGINYRLDWKLIANVANNLSQCEFHFYGPLQSNSVEDIIPTKMAIKILERLPNIYFHLKMHNRLDLASIIQTFELAWIPYNQKLRANRFSFPMKTFEYLYFNKPIVSTMIYELAFFPSIKIGKNQDEIYSHIIDLINKPISLEYKKESKELAIKNRWENKIDCIYKTIKNYSNNQPSKTRKLHFLTHIAAKKPSAPPYISLKIRKHIFKNMFKEVIYYYLDPNKKSLFTFFITMTRMIKSINSNDIVLIRVDGSCAFEKYSLLKIFTGAKIIWEIHGPAGAPFNYSEPSHLSKKTTFAQIKNRYKRYLLSYLTNKYLFISKELKSYSWKYLNQKKQSLICPNVINQSLVKMISEKDKSPFAQLIKNSFSVIWSTSGEHPWHDYNLLINIAKKTYSRDKSILFIIILSSNFNSAFSCPPNLIIINHLNYETALSYIDKSSVCLGLYNIELFKKGRIPFYHSPLKILDYSAMAKPIIASNIGTIPSMIIDKKTGFLTNNNVNEIVNLIIKLKKNKKLADSIGNAAQKHVISYFHPSKLTKTFKVLFQ